MGQDKQLKVVTDEEQELTKGAVFLDFMKKNEVFVSREIIDYKPLGGPVNKVIKVFTEGNFTIQLNLIYPDIYTVQVAEFPEGKSPVNHLSENRVLIDPVLFCQVWNGIHNKPKILKP